MSVSRVQSNSHHVGTGTSNAVTMSSGVTTGNLLVAFAATGGANTWSPPGGWSTAVSNAGSQTTSIFYVIVTAGMSGSTVFTFTQSSTNTTIIITEWNSTTGWLASPLDQSNGAANGSSTSLSAGPTGTTTQATELWTGAVGYSAGAGLQTGSGLTAGWTFGTGAAGGPELQEAYDVVSSTGAASFSFTVPTSVNWGGSIATFMPNSNPVLATSPTSMTFNTGIGGSNPASQNDTLSETAGISTAWTSNISYGSGSGWLAIAPTSGSLGAFGNTSITVSCTLGALAVGTYTATVTFTATTGGATAAIAVTFIVNNPALSTSPATMTFGATVGGSNPSGQSDTLSEINGGPTNWTSNITYGSVSGWLAIAPTSGSLGAFGNTSITVSCTTGALTVGSYTATVTFTATTGGATATIGVTFTISAAAGTYTVLLAGQNITQHVDQMSIEVDDTLGQGPGNGAVNGTSARSTTFKFNTDLGPMATAVGAGGFVATGSPVLVRNGEVVITDATGARIFGGYATKYTDTMTGGASSAGGSQQDLGINIHPHTQVEGIDYTSALGRTFVNITFSAQTDVQIINQILTAYAPWVDQSLLPSVGQFSLPAKVFRNISVLQVLQTVAGITGWIVWIDFYKKIHYVSPTTAQSAPFYLSTNPDFISSFPHNVQEFVQDDTSAINRVWFYGGKKTSNDFTQDVSPLANGNNKVFVLAYYPRVSSTGAYIVTVNGVSQVVGFANGTSTANILKSQGGSADCLINPDAHNLTFDIAPPVAATVLVTYRYNFPISIVVTDTTSVGFFGAFLEGYISDSTVFDSVVAVQRSRVVLAQQSMGLVTLKVDCWRAGLMAGQIMQIVNTARGINQAYLIQEVVTDPLGNGNFVYHVTLGAWNWNLVDVIVKLAAISPNVDTSDVEVSSFLQLFQIQTNLNLNTKAIVGTRGWGVRFGGNFPLRNHGPYYARSAQQLDGHDAFPGFATIASNS